MYDSKCRACHAPLELVLQVGPQPPSNLFLVSSGQSYPTHPLQLALCPVCGLAQLVDPMPLEMVRCTHDWLRYHEPENHLDEVATFLRAALPKKSVEARGISYKDATLLARLQRTGWHTPCTAAAEDEDIPQVQARVTPNWAKAEADRHGQADLVIARHVLEHAHNPREFVRACAALTQPDGLLLFEVPGCETMLRECQHCFLWEEHILYFTRVTLRHFLQSCELEVLDVREYITPLEGSLVALARPRATHPAPPHFEREVVGRDNAMVRSFCAALPRCKAEARAKLESLTAGGVPAMLFGAGHLGMKYINFYNLASLLQGVIDDHPRKRGLFLPGSLLQIQSSDWLERSRNGICLLALAPGNYSRIQHEHVAFIAHGGQWFSIFPGTPYSLIEQ